MKILLAVLLLVLPCSVFGQDTLPQPCRNILDVQAAFYFSEDVHQDFGFGIAYERILDKKCKWGLYLPLTVGFSRDRDFMDFFEYNNNGSNARPYQSLIFVPGIKWYAGRKSCRVKYSLGPSLYIETGRGPNFSLPETKNNYSGAVNYNVLGYMVTNSLDVHITRQFSIDAVLGTGFATNYYGQRLSAFVPFRKIDGPGVLYQCFLKAGYRF